MPGRFETTERGTQRFVRADDTRYLCGNCGRSWTADQTGHFHSQKAVDAATDDTRPLPQLADALDALDAEDIGTARTQIVLAAVAWNAERARHAALDVDRLARALHEVICGGVLHVTSPCAQGYADAIAHQYALIEEAG
jgi:hypothetical protein